MEPARGSADSKLLESRTLSVGFVLVGLAVGVTAASYLLNMEFTHQWLVWVIGAAFVGVALLLLEWPRALMRPAGRVPQGRVRRFLLLSMPLSFVIGSQVCGLGFKACSTVCHLTNLALIGLATATALQIHRGRSVGLILMPMIVLGLLPHCVCHAPVNVVWHRVLGGYSPTCDMVPLAVVLFSVTALGGFRSRGGTALATLLLGMIVFMAVGNPLIGLPWKGCV